MIAALLLAAAPVATAIDAENAFSRDAKRIGQWTAFRKWADRDAVMFTPQAVWARSFLKPLKDPPKSISWRPAQSFVSCDGRTAVRWWPGSRWHLSASHLSVCPSVRLPPHASGLSPASTWTWSFCTRTLYCTSGLGGGPPATEPSL